MIIDYKIVKEDNWITLSRTVWRHIKKGWEPQGGLVVDNYSNFLQAMVLRGGQDD